LFDLCRWIIDLETEGGVYFILGIFVDYTSFVVHRMIATAEDTTNNA
jgi:hypothetical protein